MSRSEAPRRHFGLGGWAPAAALAALCGSLMGYEAYAVREQGPGLSYHRESSLWQGLGEREWERYHSYRAHAGGHLEALTPYEMLGIHADDQQERREYARRNAQFMLRMHQRITEFEDLYRAELTGMLASRPAADAGH